MAKAVWWGAWWLTYSNASTTNTPFQTGYNSSNITLIQHTSWTLSNLYVRVRTNTLTVQTTTVTLYNYSTSTAWNLTVSISAWATGWFSDTSNTDTISSWSIYTMRIVVEWWWTWNTLHTWLCVNFEPSSNTVYCSMINNANSIATGTTYLKVAWVIAASTTESVHKTFVSHSVTAKNLYLRLQMNSSTSTTTFWLRVNWSTSSLAVSVAWSATGNFSDTSNTATLASWDGINYIISWHNNTVFPALMTCQFESTDWAHTIFAGSSSGTWTPLSNNNYCNLWWMIVQNATENNGKFVLWIAWTLSKLHVNVQTNTRNGTCTIRTRINWSSWTCYVSITASTTGQFSDTTNSDTITSTDLVNYYITVWWSTWTCSVSTISILLSTPTSSTSIKTIFGLAYASTKTVQWLALASMKSFWGLT